MNWKEYAYLFANRKFQAMTEDDTYPISGFYFGFGGGYFILENHIGHIKKQVKDCILIARKIEDMTDEERGIYNDKRIANVMGGSTESPNSFIYALSAGCLPKCFEHQFKTGEVIDIKTL